MKTYRLNHTLFYTIMICFLIVIIWNYIFFPWVVKPFSQLLTWDISWAIATAIDFKYFTKILVIIFTETMALSWAFFMVSKKFLG